MTIRIAAGTLFAGTIAAAVALFLPRPGMAGMTFAEVERQVNATQTVTLTQVESAPGRPDETSRLLVRAPNLIRYESESGFTITDTMSKKAMIVRHKEKRVQILEGLAVPAEPRNFYAWFKDLARSPTKAIPDRVIDGKPAVGFLVRVNSVESSVWADPATRLPVRAEMTFGDGAGARKQVLTDVAFDRPLDPALFRMDLPEGYAVETFGVLTLAPEAGDRDVDAPVVTPLVGIGPARFGMTREQVIAALGEPDREVKQGTILFLAYYSRGFELSFLPPQHPLHGLNRVTCLGQHGFAVKVREFRGKTDKGIGLGASRDDIIKAYGPPDDEHISRMRDVFGKRASDPEALTGQTELRYRQLYLSFTLYQGKAYQIAIDVRRPKPVAKPEKP